MDRFRNPPKRAKQGYERFFNSPNMSDILIRYGDEGERTLHGHRVVLSARSRWFNNAFNGSFMERDATEITLKEDDPEALEAVIRCAYDHHFTIPQQDNNATSQILLCLNSWKVADKYEFGAACEHIGIAVQIAFDDYIRESNINRFSPEGFQKITDVAFSLPHPGDETFSIQKRLVFAIIRSSTMSPLSNRGKLYPALMETVAKNAELGSAIFQAMMNKCVRQGRKVTLQVMEDVMCPACRTIFMVQEEAPGGRCWNCGRHDDYWLSYCVADSNHMEIGISSSDA